jgi:protein-tyrosine phosphatase
MAALTIVALLLCLALLSLSDSVTRHKRVRRER